MAALVEATTGGAVAAAEREDEEASKCERGGGAAKRALWKWACAETARQTSPRGQRRRVLLAIRVGAVRSLRRGLATDARRLRRGLGIERVGALQALLDARVDAVIDGRDPGTPGPVLVDDDDGSGDKRWGGFLLGRYERRG